MTITVPKMSALTAAQWLLLLRAYHANASGWIGPGKRQVSDWMQLSDAADTDVMGLQQSGQLVAMRNGEPCALSFHSGQPSSDYAVILTAEGRKTATRLDAASKVLIYLSAFSERGVPLRDVLKDADRWGALVEMDTCGLISTRRTNSEDPVPLAPININDPLALRHIMVKITSKGRPYATRWDT